MACSVKSISKEELIKVYSYVNGFLLEEMNAGKPYSMEMLKARSLALYNTIVSLMGENVNGGKIKAADYASTIPDVVLDVIHTYFDPKSGEKKLFNHAMNSVFPWAEVYSLVKNINDLPTKERIRFIESWLGIGPTEASELEEKQQIADDIELQKKQQLEGNAATTAAPGGVITVDDINIKTLQNEGEEFAAVPSTVLKSAGNEKVNGSEEKDMNPRKVFYFKVIRSLLKLVSGTNGNDSRNSVTDGASGIHIMFVSGRQAMKMGLGDYTIDSATHYYAVPVSSTGEVLYFEPVNGENVSSSELGTPIMFAIPRIGYDSQTNTYYFEGKADRDKWLDKTIRSYARHNKVTMEEARLAVQTEMGYNYAIAQRLRQNPEDMSIMGYINGGGRGYILNDVNVRTFVASINFTDGPQSYTIAVDTQGAIDPQKKGTSYLTTNDVGQGRPLRIWLPKLDTDTIETIATLFTTPMMNTENNAPLSFGKRRDLLDQFVNRMGISNRVTLNWDSLDKPEFRLTIDNEKMDLSTAEGIEKAKEKLRSILGNQYLIINNKLSSSQGYDPVNIEKTSGISVKYTPSTSNYYQFLERKGIYLNYKTDANNKLALYNPYISFGIDMSVMSELTPLMTVSVTEFQAPQEREAVRKEQKNLLAEYKGKLIYGTPGVGKTTAIGMNPNLVDMDDLLVEEIKKVKGNTTFGVPYADVTNETVGIFLESLFTTDNNEAELIYEDVYDKAMGLIEKEGKTVLTGSHRFAGVADVLFLNDRVDDLSVTLLDKGKSIGSDMISAVNTILASQQAARGIQGKTVVDMDGKFMSDVLFEAAPAASVFRKVAPSVDTKGRFTENSILMYFAHIFYLKRNGNIDFSERELLGLSKETKDYLIRIYHTFKTLIDSYEVYGGKEMFFEGRMMADTDEGKIQVARMLLSNDPSGRDNGLINGINKPTRIEQFEYPSKAVLKNLDEVFNGESSKYDAELTVLSAAPSAPVSDIEAKKADIERRRKEELKVWREKYSEFFEKAGKQSTNPEQNQKDIAGLEADYQKYVDDTNAKYDVELARELYKEMKAGKLVTDMTPAEQQVADNYITEELRKSVDAELAALGAPAAPMADNKLTSEEADWLYDNLKQITEKYNTSTLADSIDPNLKTPLKFRDTTVTAIEPRAGDTSYIWFERPTGKWLISIDERNGKQYLTLSKFNDKGTYYAQRISEEELQNLVDTAGLRSLIDSIYKDTNIEQPKTRQAQFEAQNALQQKYGIKRTYKDIVKELAALGAAPAAAAPFTEGNEEALKMLEELGEANFNKIMANHPELVTYDTKDVDELIAEPTDDVSWNVKNEALIDYLSVKDITYQNIKSMLAKQDAYGQSGIELLDQDEYHVRSITFKELMDLIMDEITQVKPELVYKNLQQIPFTYDMPDSTIPPVQGGLDPSMFDNEEIYKLATQKAGEIKATPEQIKAAEEWYNNSPLKQYIPFQVVFKAINSNPSAVAQWTRDGVILTKRADFTDYYHEAFHGFIHTFMTKEQLDGLFEATRMLPGTFTDYNGDRVAFDMATDKQLEEFLAEGFRNYMLDPGKYKFNSKEEKSVFQWLINVLRMLFEDVTWDMITRDTVDTSTMIYDLYEKLRVGDLTGYSFQTENTVFDRTNNGMVAIDENDPVSKLDWASTYEIVRSMDSLISEYGDVEALLKNKMIDFAMLARFNQIRDRKYSKLAMHKTFTPEEEKLWLTVNNMIAAQREKEGGFSIGILKNKKMRSNFYSYIRSRFIDKINFYNQALALIPEGTSMRAELQKKIDTLQWSVRNFGDKDFLDSNVVSDSFGNIRGVIGYHMMNTDLFDRADKEAFIENVDINEDDIYVSMAENGRVFDEGGNTMSIIERADADILYLLHSLYEPTADTATTFVPKVNTLGFAEMMPFDRVWNNIVRLLENMDDRIDMYNALKNEIRNFPAYGQLLSKLGTPQIGKEIKPQAEGVAPVYEQSPNFNMRSFTIWNKMLQTFDNVHIPLIQTTIHETFDVTDGVRGSKPTYTVTAGTASAVYKRVGERWESTFQEMVPSITNFVGRTVENNNILMTGKAYAFPQLVLASTPDQFIEFLNKIGISLSDSQSIKSAIRYNDGIKRDIIAIQAKVRKIAEYNSNEANKEKIIISSINSLINVEKPDVGNVSSGIKKLSSVYTRLQELESRYSDFHSNFMVTNAEAEQQYEHTLQSTITRIVKVLNDTAKYPTFQSVIANPKMKYLNPANNYWAEISTVLNSLFILQDETGKPLSESDPRYGKRRVYPKTQEFVKIEVNNLSGIALMAEDQWKSGIANASSDTVSKLLSEIHNFAHIQTMEVMRHSDKKFSYAVGTDYVFANGKFSRTYVDVMEFLPGGSGMTNATNLIKQHLSAELKRINKFKSVDETGLVYDFRYLDRGKDFVLFKDMPVELEKRLLGLSSDKSLMEHMAENLSLNQDVSKYLRDWLTNLSNSLYNKLSGNMFFSLPYSNLVSPKVMIDAFVANNVIHNLESLVLIYGDPAMYAIEKEEFHKRNSGAGGTGKISATDAAALNFINSANFNKDGYAISRLGRQNIQTRLYDGTLDTAILKDPIMRSAYYDSIAEYKKKALEKRNKSAEEINEILYGKDGTHEKPTGGEMKPYAKMKVADAQGYITFDAYRMMRSSQGRWSDIQETYYQRIIKGQPVSQENLLEVFPPEKYQYWGQLDIKADLPGVVAMHKFALIPLIPTMIKENTTLTMLHDKMMAEGIHYATFDSGSKIGTLTTGRQQDTVFSDDQSMTIAPDFKTRPFTKNTIFSDYLKVQVEIAPEFKGEIALASQLRKIIEDGYMEGGVPTDFRMDVKDVNERIKLWEALTPQQKLDESEKYKEMLGYEEDLNSLFEAKKAELIEEMGIQLDDEGKISAGFENFINFVKRELNRREIGNHTINMIGVNEKGDLKMPLDLSLEADTIERILNNIISKRLVKFKVKGEHLIQVSNALFDDRNFTSKPGRNFEKATPEELEKYGSIDLPYYRIATVNGKEVVRLAKCKIAITGDFYNLLYLNDKDGREIAVYDTVNINGKRKRVLNRAASVAKLNALLKDEEWLDTGDHRKMVTIAGPRIPVQGLNSAEAYEVYEFLPEESGPIIVTPAEIVAKSGSDFDKDTLFMLTPHIYRINGKVKLMDSRVKTSLTKEQIKEKLSDLYDQRKKLYAELYNKDARFNELKDRLSPEEIQAYQNLKEEYIERKNELLGTINNLRSTLLKYAKGKIRLTSPESVKLDNQLYQAYVNLDILEYNFSRNRATYIGTFKEAAIEPLNNEIESLTEQLYALSSASKENALLQRWVSMISNIDNYDALTRPNDTNIVKPVADDLSQFNDVADGKKWMFRDDMTGIAATRILEIEYNMYKHESNNVGKQVLGIGAVDNTYNILLNRIGAYMNPFMAEGVSQQRAQALYEKVISGQPLTANERNEYNKANIFKQTIYLKHNTLDKVGGKAISLSHMYDADNKNRIGDVISQLINGWVDVAKDAWVFNLQGNKELAPTLLFMIQAGVPFETAAYFVSQPIIKEYVKQQRLAKSAFGRPLGLAPDQPNMFRNQARARILTDSRYGFVNNKDLKFNVDKVSNVYKQRFPILQMAAEFVPKIMKEEGNEFSFEKLKEGVGKSIRDIDNFQRALFLHFLELEEMGKAMTALKTTTNVDTARTGTLYSAISRIIKLNELEENPRIPGKEMLRNLKENSPIGSFFIQDFQLDRARDLFPIRASESTMEFIKKHAGKLKGDLKKTFGADNEEEFWQAYRNNMVSFIFQSTLYNFNPRELTVYRGARVDKNFGLAKVQALYQRVVVKEKDGKPTLYIDLKGIEDDFNTGAFAEGKLKPTVDAKVPFAALDRETFDELSSIILDNGFDESLLEDDEMAMRGAVDIVKSRETFEEKQFRKNQAKRDQYIKFVIEREITRSQIPLSKAKGMFEYNLVLRFLDPKITENRDLVAYEEFLKNRALDNIFSPYKMFMSRTFNYAQTFFHIKNQFPQLAEQFRIFEALSMDGERSKLSRNIRNLRLRNTRLTKNQINLYKENLSQLADPKVKKVENAEDNAFISRFFAMMPFYGYIQAGLNANGRYSLNKILPPENFAKFMTSYVREYGNYLDNDNPNLAFHELYYPAFVNAETVSGKRYSGGSRVKVYGTPMNLEYLSRLDNRPSNYVEKVMREEGFREDHILTEEMNRNFPTYNTEWGMTMFRPSISIRNFSTTNLKSYIEYYNWLANNTRQNPSKGPNMFVHNALTNPQDVTMMNVFGDWFFSHPNVKVTNKIGIPLMQYDMKTRKPVTFTDTIVNGVAQPNETLKQQIDEAMVKLKDLSLRNNLIFNTNGYGLDLQVSAPVTYLYLSEALAKNFGYVNPGAKSSPNSVKVIQGLESYYQQEMTYEEAAELYQKCLL